MRNQRSLKTGSVTSVISMFIACFSLCFAEEHRDWQQYPAIAQVDMPVELYALGDVHGDYERLVEVLVAGRILSNVPDKPEHAKWSGAKSVLVVTGDFIDKYNHSLEVISLFRTIQNQAVSDGGRVIVTLGNHEAEFLATGTSGKKSAMFRKELEAAGLNTADVVAGRDSNGIGQWLHSRPIAAKVGDWFFCHAGNAGRKSLATLERDLEADITSHGYSAPILSNPNSILQARMHPRQWWDAAGDVQLKELVSPPVAANEKSFDSEKKLRAIVEALGCKHLVIGHQPGKITFADGSVRDAGQIFTKFGGLFFMTDTGMSRGANSGRGGLLKIQEDANHIAATAIYSDGKSVSIFP